MTYNNEEVFPIIKRIVPPNVSIDSVIRGSGNIISGSARNVIVSGDNNIVELEAENVSMLNCSGCIVSSGVIGSTLINCSGISVYEDNLLYINNELFKLGGSISSGAYTKITNNYNVLTTDEVIDSQHTASGKLIVLPTPVGNHKKFTVKNNSPTFDDIKVVIYGYNIDNTQISGLGQVTLSYLDSVTVISDGVDNYLIT